MGKTADGFKWYPRHPVKMIRGVRGLGAAAIGAYNVILDLIYEDEGSCPNDPAFIGGILGESSRQTRALIGHLAMAGKIQIDGDRIRNAQAEAIIERRLSQARAQRESGSKGGRSTQARVAAMKKTKGLGQASLENLEEKRIEQNNTQSVVPSESSSKPPSSLEQPARTPAAPKVTGRKIRLPDGFPSQAAKEGAVKFWTGKGRHDLVASVEDQAEQFRDHFTGHGKSMVDWPATWRTWVRNALEFNRPPRPGTVSAPAPSGRDWAPTTTEDWVRCLGLFHTGAQDGGIDPGYWGKTWGPAPGAPGCRVPADALKAYAALNRPRVAAG